MAMTTIAANGQSVASHQIQSRLPLVRSANSDWFVGHTSGPGALAVDPFGNLYAATLDGILRFDASGNPTRLGSELNPGSIATDSAGNIYLADTANNRILKLAPATGVIATVAGNGLRGFSGDGGDSTNAQLDGPTGVTVDAAGNLYIADGTGDGRDCIRRVDSNTGVITTMAGNGSKGFSGDGGPATLAQFNSLGGLATDASGNLYIADNFNHRIRMVSVATGVITTIAGNGVAGDSGDGGLATDAQLNNPLAVAINPAGDLYIADSGNLRIRKVTASGKIVTSGGNLIYPDNRHGFPCALAVDNAGNLYVADAGVSRIRKISAGAAGRPLAEPDLAAAHAAASLSAANLPAAGGFKIVVTYDSSVPAAAQTAFNNLVSAYQSAITSNITVNIDVTFGNTGLGSSWTQETNVSYQAWRTAMIANATANPGNTYSTAAAASLPLNDPIGNGSVRLTTANARAIGFTANAVFDSTLTFSNSVNFEYSGVASGAAIDFMDVAAHELDEGLGIGSALTGLADNAALPAGYAAEDYFRYSAAGTRAITTNPSAIVYFSYDGGVTNVAQFNQANVALGITGLDRNDWVYGNYGCPAAPVYIQDAIACYGQAVPVGSGPEIAVLKTLGYDSGISQTITFAAIGNVTIGAAPFSISATASSGLTVSFTSTTLTICTVSGSTVTIVATGACSITASQAGNTTYSAAAPVVRGFTVNPLPAPVLTSPVNGAAGVSLTPTLSWNASAGATSYDVYFGTSSTPGFVVNTAATSYTTAALTLNASYYWKIVAKNSSGSTSSTTFSFSTGSSCTFAGTPMATLIAYAGSSKSVNVTAGAGCSWTATSHSSWLTVTSGSGTGNGTISFSVPANSGIARMGTITFAGQTLSVMQGGSPSAPIFNDVSASDPYFDYVSLLQFDGVTAGCAASPPLYCPGTPVTRAQMSVFIVAALNRAQGTSLTYTQTPYFQDVASGSSYFPFVQRIKDLGITAGCSASPSLFCPDTTITQGQMAVFMIAGWMLENNLSTFTYTTTPYFTDVPSTDPYFSFVQKMRDMGFWNGCSATLYCESSAVTRDQMAPMIMRSLLSAP